MVRCRTLGVQGSLYGFMLLWTTSLFTQVLTQRSTRGDGLHAPVGGRPLYKGNGDDSPVLLSTRVLATLRGHFHIFLRILTTEVHDR